VHLAFLSVVDCQVGNSIIVPCNVANCKYVMIHNTLLAVGHSVIGLDIYVSSGLDNSLSEVLHGRLI